ncbi:hypothetical protein [Flavobacterium eburneipallidum]|uniref:hypothetical protein n=1 Tax=Flavobacterium eburneipallidum TaxID=3003263 RepID=UPI0022AC675D|nr:hypothetical protein [Flavobacterium eburneipallidum]
MKPYLFLFSILFLFLSCQQPPKIPTKPQSFHKEKITPDDIETITPQEAKTFHQDKKHDYEYRTGNSGHYEYNYDVIGKDQDSNKVSGKINIEGKYGAGKIDDNQGNPHNIEVEWYGKGKLKAVDENGKAYELEVK